MQTLAQQVASFVREASNPMPIKSTFVHGDGRFITPTTVITMPDGDTAMFCSLNYDEKRMVLHTNASGGGRWLRDGSFTLFKKDMV
jgi:hypothetical protein